MSYKKIKMRFKDKIHIDPSMCEASCLNAELSPTSWV